MSWRAALLATPAGTSYQAVMGPQEPGEPTLAYAVRWICLWGCSHLLALEDALGDAIEVGGSRLEALGNPPESTLVVVCPISRHHIEQEREAAKHADEYFRGCQH